MENGQFVKTEPYKIDENNTIDVYFLDYEPWLTQNQMAKVLGIKKTAVSIIINDIYSKKELDKNLTSKRVTEDGVERTFYSLGLINAVCFKVNQERAEKFRDWADEQIFKKEDEYAELREWADLLRQLFELAIQGNQDAYKKMTFYFDKAFNIAKIVKNANARANEKE